MKKIYIILILQWIMIAALSYSQFSFQKAELRAWQTQVNLDIFIGQKLDQAIPTQSNRIPNIQSL